MRLRRPLIMLAAAVVTLAVTAVPSQATFAKLYTLNVTPTPVAEGANDQPFTATYVGKSLYTLGSSNLTAPVGFTDVKNVVTTRGTASVSGTTIRLRSISLGLGAVAKVTFTADVPVNVPCGNKTYTWSVLSQSSSTFTGTNNFNLTSPSSLTTVANGVCPTTINVSKYEDVDANGSNGEEPSLEGWTFTANGGNAVTTNADGNASFTLPPGVAYDICEVDQPDWVNTDPGTGCILVTAAQATSGGTVNLSFGNAHDITIDVTKFNDVDLDGIFDEEESGLQGWEFTVNGDTEGAATTNSDGNASFTVPAGAEYEVCETPQDGWASTTGGDCQTVPASDATSNAQIDLSFGNAEALACGDSTPVDGTPEGTTVTITNVAGEGCQDAVFTATFDGGQLDIEKPEGQNVTLEVNVDAWDPEPVEYPVPATQVSPPPPAHDGFWCDETSPGSYAPPAGESWCLISQSTVLAGQDGEGAQLMQVTEVWLLDGDATLCRTCR